MTSFESIKEKLNHLGENVRVFLKRDTQLTEGNDDESNPDDEGVTFYETENAEIARGAKKAPAKGLDSFGEKDTFEFDEADDYQTNRDRKQNSDLSKRYYTTGLDIDNLDKH